VSRLFLRETIADRINIDQAEPEFVDWFITESARAPVEVLARIVPLMASMGLVPELPKTRSGKIMRRLLRDVAEGRDLGDTSTLVDPKVFDAIRGK